MPQEFSRQEKRSAGKDFKITTTNKLLVLDPQEYARQEFGSPQEFLKQEKRSASKHILNYSYK